jgi:hypothetical protein
MWFLIPLALGGGLLLHNLTKKDKELELDEEDIIEKGGIKIEYRRIYICHSYDDSSLYKKLAKKLKYTEDYRVFNHSIPKEMQKMMRS